MFDKLISSPVLWFLLVTIPLLVGVSLLPPLLLSVVTGFSFTWLLIDLRYYLQTKRITKGE